MKKTNLKFGLVLLISLLACNEETFLTSDSIESITYSTDPLAAENLAGAFAKPGIEQGGYVFAGGDETKANPEGYPELNLVRNRWGWAGNLEATIGGEAPVSITYDQFSKTSPQINLYLGDENPVVIGYVTITSAKIMLTPVMTPATSEALNVFIFLNLPGQYVFSSEQIEFEILDATNTNIIYSRTFTPDENKNAFVTTNAIGNVNQPVPVADIPGFSLGDEISIRLSVPVKRISDGLIMPEPAKFSIEGANPDVASFPTYVPTLYTNTYYLIPAKNAISVIPNPPISDYGTIAVTNDATNIYYEITLNEGYNFIETEGSTIYGFIGNPAVGMAIPIDIPYSEIADPYTSYKITIPISNVPEYVLGGLINSKICCRINAENFTSTPGDIIPVSGYLNNSWTLGVWYYTNTQVTSVTTQEFPIYADAGLNYTSHGTLVGTAYVTYDGDKAKIKYDLLPEFLMEAVYIYADDAAVSSLSSIPFGFSQVFDNPVNEFETTLDVPDIDGDNKAWFILHAKVLL